MRSRQQLLSSTWYRHYVLAVLFVAYVVNVVDRSPVLGISLQAIKLDFRVSDTALGLLSGIAFAVFYSTLGMPIAALADRSSRRNVLAASVAVWCAMTACCGLAVNFGMLFAARVGTAVGEAGGSPASHSLISDYFPRDQRGRAFSILALGVGTGTALGTFLAGRLIGVYGWRMTFVLVGLPGLFIALLVRFTIVEPPRGFADGGTAPARLAESSGLVEAIRTLGRRRSFRHLALAAALHSVAWYASGAFNAAFFQRSHHMSAGSAANWLTVFAGTAVLGTLAGGVAADRWSVSRQDKRWYFWVPAGATVLMTPVQVVAYLTPSLSTALPAFGVMTFFAAVFFGPSFAMTQALATVRMRSIATSLLFFVQTLIGYGLGPLVTGYLSDRLMPAFGQDSLRYALAIVGCVNIWAATHYFLGARTLRDDLQEE
jgi:MFS family permease